MHTVKPHHSAPPRWKSVALPTEHGGWAFIGEPILLGLLIAFTWGGLALGVAALAVFLLRQPLKLLIKDIQHRRSVPRTATARRFVRIYGLTATLAGMLMLWHLPNLLVLLPLALSAPLIAALLWHDVHNESRALVAELAGAVATGSIAASMLLMADKTLPIALGVWLALGVKSLTAVLYVRTRLRLERGQAAGHGRTVAIVAHILGVGVLSGAAALAWGTWGAALAQVILTARAALGLSAWRAPRAAKHIGMQEVGYGLMFILLVAVGNLYGI